MAERTSRTGGFRRQRCREERGAAMVEFAIVVVLLSSLLFGIISFGVALSAKQTVTQAAAEGARAALTPNYSSSTDRLTAQAAALAQAQSATSWMKLTCDANDANGDGLACDVPTPVHCDGTPDTVTGRPDCITVTVTYAYRSHPIVPSIPLLDSVMPQTLKSVAVVSLGGS